MLHTQNFDPLLAKPISDQSITDYERVCAALAYITEKSRRQPSLEDIAAHVGLSPSHFHHLFHRWAGLTPKEFLQAVTLDHAKRLLSNQASLFDTSLEVGLSGPSRLHDLFVTHEAMTPGDWKAGGEGLVMRFGFHPSPFGETVVVITDRGLAGLGWVDDKAAPGKAADIGKHAGGRAGALADMRRRWPKAAFVEDSATTALYAAQAFNPEQWCEDRPLRVVLIGTDFEVRVWERLLNIPIGHATTYSTLANQIGNPKASRAVGTAVGKNPISFVVPCHRVLGKSGALTGYHWGITRKQAILGWEVGQRAKAG